MHSHPLRRFIGAAMCILGLGLASPSSAELSNPLPSASREQLLAQRDELWADLATHVGDVCNYARYLVLMECLEPEEAARLCRRIFDLDEQLQRDPGDYDVLAARLLCTDHDAGLYYRDNELMSDQRLLALKQIHSDSLRYRGRDDLITFAARYELLEAEDSGDYEIAQREVQAVREAHDATLAVVEDSLQEVRDDIRAGRIQRATRDLERRWGSNSTLLPYVLMRLAMECEDLIDVNFSWSQDGEWLENHRLLTALRVLGPYAFHTLDAASHRFRRLMEERRFVEAEDLLRTQLGERNPFTIYKAPDLGNVYRKLGLDLRLRDFYTAVTAAPLRAPYKLRWEVNNRKEAYWYEYADMFQLLGVVAEEQGQTDEAERHFLTATQRAKNPQLVPLAALFFARKKLNVHDYNGAIEDAQQLVDISRDELDESRSGIERTLGPLEVIIAACQATDLCTLASHAEALGKLFRGTRDYYSAPPRWQPPERSMERVRDIRHYFTFGLRAGFDFTSLHCGTHDLNCGVQERATARAGLVSGAARMAGWDTMRALEAAAFQDAVSRQHPQLRPLIARLRKFDNDARELAESWNPYFAIEPRSRGEEEFREKANRILSEACPGFAVEKTTKDPVALRSGKASWTIPLEELPLQAILSEALPQCYAKLDTQIAAEDPAYRQLTPSSFVNPEDIQSYLSENEAVIVYVIDDFSLAGVVRKDNIEFRPLDWRNEQGDIVPLTRADVERLVDTMSSALEFDPLLEARPKAFSAKAAHDLYRMLLEPIEPWLAGVDHILLVKDAAIARLPFELLLTEDPGAEWLDEIDPNQPPAWLIEQYAFSTLPGLRSLRFLRDPEIPKDRSGKKNFLGIGNPLLGDHPADLFGASGKPLVLGGHANLDEIRKLPAVPQTREALHGMARRFEARGYRTRVLEGEQARESALHAITLSDYSWITFLTHALVAGENGTEEPGIVLTPPPLSPSKDQTPDPRDDGVLTMSDVAQLDLSAEFVVLGGCRTAAPKASGGEALSGLARAFFYAGAESLLVSHWPVDVNSGVELLDGMVRKLTDDHTLGKSQALRQASLELIKRAGRPDLEPTVPKRYAHPFYWGSFFVVGDGGKPLAAAPFTSRVWRRLRAVLPSSSEQ